jgi:hypothetical protein
MSTASCVGILAKAQPRSNQAGGFFVRLNLLESEGRGRAALAAFESRQRPADVETVDVTATPKNRES